MDDEGKQDTRCIVRMMRPAAVLDTNLLDGIGLDARSKVASHKLS